MSARPSGCVACSEKYLSNNAKMFKPLLNQNFCKFFSGSSYLLYIIKASDEAFGEFH